MKDSEHIEFSPLQLLIGSALWRQFVPAGFVDLGALKLYLHTHNLTRRVIAVSEDLRTWGQHPDGTWAPLPLFVALAYVFEDAEQLGAFPR